MKLYVAPEQPITRVYQLGSEPSHVPFACFYSTSRVWGSLTPPQLLCHRKAWGRGDFGLNLQLGFKHLGSLISRECPQLCPTDLNVAGIWAVGMSLQ